MNLQPIVPFEPIKGEAIPEGDEWVHQIKWDGVRILTYCDGHEVRLFNRRKNERTSVYPELLETDTFVQSHSFILDGEVIALNDQGKPSFHEVMKRDGIRHFARVPQLLNAIPVTYMIFDMLYCDGKWLTERPFFERAALLQKIIRVTDRIQLVPSYEDGRTLFDVARKQDLEGIVSKKRNSPYLIHGKNANWRKIKKVEDIIAVVGGVTYRDGSVNALLLGLYNQKKQLIYIGRAGTGKLTHEDWKVITKVTESLRSEVRPFLKIPLRVKSTQWLQPVLTVKVTFSEWTTGHALRQPIIQAFVQTDPLQCRFEED
ncbi:DNA ligase [Sporolactobacillus kofuensis]|uniref:DNA ligase (ATP) n=1 Tax=Sporolactobacillus kofuensis TaxID=269672 RepID=A0ABW1W9J6_9BACL|nr:DNA ligase [Sporolactobacillus kofuensis]MCO7175997.1 DNA ligase [Sporolactobacillus kofuensis]